MTTELSNAAIEKISTEIADKVCHRIGEAILNLSLIGIAVGLGGMVVGAYMNRRSHRRP